jgi:aspartate carbamoyltransferase catalytic subunit
VMVPTNILPRRCLDAFTIRERKGKIDGLNVTILGDILYSRVRDQTFGLLRNLAPKSRFAVRPTLVPRVFEQMGCRVTHKHG